MNTKNTKAFSLMLMLFFLSPCYGADTTITITGVIKASPCTVGAPVAIDFGSLDYTRLKQSQFSESITKRMVLTNCPIGTSKVKATFSGPPLSDFGGSNYANAVGEGYAKGVFLNLLQNATNVGLGNNQSVSVAVDDSSRNATIEFNARLGVTSKYGDDREALTPGLVNVVVSVTFTYS